MWTVKSIPKDKVLDLSKVKAFADEKIMLTQKLKFVFWRREKILEVYKKSLVASISFFCNSSFESLLSLDLWKLGMMWLWVSLPDDKILDWSKFKAFADDKINVKKKLKFGLGRVENIVRNGENAGYQHFLLFPQCFQKASFPGLF